MHDGSAATLMDVMVWYDDGGHKDPDLDTKVKKLDLEDAEINALVKFMEALTGEGPKETPLAAFPKQPNGTNGPNRKRLPNGRDLGPTCLLSDVSV